MPWSDAIIEQFELIDRLEDETEYYGPYNTLLNNLFPYTEHFQVVPQYKGPITPGSIDFATTYVVRKQKCPVFFIEMNPFTHLDRLFTREKADAQMRAKFYALIDRNLVVPKLYGISAMGTISRDPKYMIDVAPADRWTHELLEPAGEAKMKELVASIKAMCADIA